ncbi:MAG: hypothetical protein MZW92_19755 [Comamonadaceae bacterium]|nr:hypothetical protein [Comamonadaceae bacterium]
MLKSRGGDSVFSLFLEVDEPLESFGKIAHGHFFYTPSKTGLGETHRGELDHLLNNFEKIDKERILAWLDKFTRLNTYEISVPGLKDPELAPPGKTGLIISFLAEYDLFRLVQEAGWLDEFIAELENRVLQVISDSVYPMLKDKIIVRFSFSPLSIENRVGSSEGRHNGMVVSKEHARCEQDPVLRLALFERLCLPSIRPANGLTAPPACPCRSSPANWLRTRF